MSTTRSFWPRVLAAAAAGLVAGLFAPAGLAGDDILTVHEWGTFTCLQDDRGREMTGINIDDEPVPKFVHNLAPFIQSQAVLSTTHWEYRQKAAPRQHPLVTMRLETPVLYFYPPKHQEQPMTLHVDVRFRGGWLTEFYPEADADLPGLRDGGFRFSDLSSKTIGRLSWNDLKVGTEGVGPETDAHVWLAPRKVNSVNVTAQSGESERYLFYRGIGQQRSPLRVERGKSRDQLRIFGNFDEALDGGEKARVPALWLVDVRPGETRYRALPAITAGTKTTELLAEVDMDSGQWKTGLDALRAEMHKALVADGLYEDEATAMLSTWNRAYFQSEGLRLFFLVPRKWTDHYLPLSISEEAHINRVMIGRIELVTDRQRALLERLSATAPSNGRWIDEVRQSPAAERFFAGRSDFGDLGVKIPADYQMYLALGRFRNALVVAEERARRTDSLTTFINTYGLHPFRIPPPEARQTAENVADDEEQDK
ncbi:MAG: hypothetical protein HYS13_22770 [Planctomycetia bacterium]|nr:hypothetical protein [Planctomycetia bacterium]